jgi:hypothetical protein
MPSTVFESIKNFLFPERTDNNYSRRDTPVEGLTLAHEMIFKLADQIEAHAAGAPYPHIRQTLEGIAIQKLKSVKKLQTLIEKFGEKPRLPLGESKPGKNHWERLNFDLQDQIALDDFLFNLELKSGETPEIAKMIEELRSSQKSHRQVLSDLVAIADPQATQT